MMDAVCCILPIWKFPASSSGAFPAPDDQLLWYSRATLPIYRNNLLEDPAWVSLFYNTLIADLKNPTVYCQLPFHTLIFSQRLRSNKNTWKVIMKCKIGRAQDSTAFSHLCCTEIGKEEKNKVNPFSLGCFSWGWWYSRSAVNVF